MTAEPFPLTVAITCTAFLSAAFSGSLRSVTLIRSALYRVSPVEKCLTVPAGNSGGVGVYYALLGGSPCSVHCLRAAHALTNEHVCDCESLAVLAVVHVRCSISVLSPCVPGVVTGLPALPEARASVTLRLSE